MSYAPIFYFGLARVLLASLFYSLCLVTSGSQPNSSLPYKEKDCLWQILHGDQDPIECAFPLRPSGPDLVQMRKISRNVLKDAFCNVEVKLARSFFDKAVEVKDHSLKIPPQPVNCTVVTKKKTYPITFHFAPEVKFKDGVAVEATPGMGKVEGVSTVLSWPIRKWLNSADMIEEPMLRVVNALVERQRKRPAK